MFTNKGSYGSRNEKKDAHENKNVEMFTLLYFLTNIVRNFFSLTLYFTIRRPKRRKSREKFLRKKFENIFLFLAFDRNPLEDKYFINHTSSVTTCFPS